MRKLLIVFFIFCFSFVSAEDKIVYYQTTEFAMKQIENNKWSDWSKWEESGLVVTFNMTKDIITIYSPKIQIYNIKEYCGHKTDKYGGSQVTFNFIDNDGYKGVIRLRIEKNGNSQLYIEFSNIMWVYNVIKVY